MHPWRSILVGLLTLGGVVCSEAAERSADGEPGARPTSSRPWSFEPVRNPPVPKVSDPGWVRTPVDAFVRAGMEARGVEPVTEADRRTLIRRLTFDLTGLPPSAAEVAEFEADASPEAYDRVLERLLASPRYGERWGRHWLDVVRYADTAGDTADYPVFEAWRYRDWVIAAFNADQPYDAFLRDQIAGDIVAEEGPRDRYADRVTATGFLALSRRFGFDSENYHHLTIQDTLDTLGQAVLGLSLGCARCHDHKFDPVTMRDYYALYGIFSSTRYPFPGSEQKGKSRALVPLVPPVESQPLWRAHDRRVADLSARLARAKKPVPGATYRSLHDPDGDFEMQKEAAGGSYGVLVPPWMAQGEIGAKTTAQSPFRNQYPSGRVGASIAGGSRDYRLEQSLRPLRTAASAPRLGFNLDFRTTPTGGPGVAHRLRLGPGPEAAVLELRISGTALLAVQDGRPEAVADVRAGEWHNLQLELDLVARTWSGCLSTVAGTGVTQVACFAGKPLTGDPASGVGYVIFDSGARADGDLPGLDLDHFALPSEPLDPPWVGDSAGPRENTAEAAGTEETSAELIRSLVEGPVPMAYAVVEGTPLDARVQKRGEPGQPGEVVPRGFIRSLGGESLPAGVKGSGRRELADWLTRPDHPLTARVMVNRIWQHHFGRGLVATPNDFGSRGRRPTDPALLDYLAARFIHEGWSVKAVHRWIVRSATYRQGSPRPGAGAAEEEAWAGYPRRRLEAEELRDAILRVSDDLEEPQPGRHPFPSPVQASYTQHGPFSAVYDHRRRSVYLMTQRLKRHPFLALFDGADPNSSTPVRGSTIVPTQALYFLNDPFVHRQSARWAAELERREGGDAARVDLAWHTALGRGPTEEEQGEALGFLAAYRAEGGGGAGGAALAAYLRSLLGSNEFLYLD